MRKERELAADYWYDASMKANNNETLFLSEHNRWLFEWTFSEAKKLYAFEARGLRFDGAKVSFFIKPADGFELPAIMQWIKQMFAVRFNRDHGRPGPGR
jgi:hypothetical protein